MFGKIKGVLWIGTISLSPCLYLNISFFRENQATGEALLVVWISLLILRGCFARETCSRLNYAELAFLGFYVFSVLIEIARDIRNYPGLLRFLFPVLFYSSMKSLFAGYSKVQAIKIIRSLFLLLLAVYLVLLIWHWSTEELLLYAYLPNASIFSVLVAAQVIFLTGVYYQEHSAPSQIFKVVLPLRPLLIISGLCILVLTQGRSGWVGFAVAFFSLNLLKTTKQRIPFKVKISGVVFLLAFLCMLIQFKPGSSSGRMLIYKISFQMLSDHWIWGIGHEAFSKQYNLYQSRYFESADIDSTEALLADNVYYAFNDLLQLFIEQGIICMVLFLLALFLFIRQAEVLLSCNSRREVIPFIIMLICISTSSFFIYPFHHLPVVLLVAMGLAFCNSFPDFGKILLLPKCVSFFWKELRLIIAFMLVINAGERFLSAGKSVSARELAEAGFKKEAMLQYEKMCKSSVADGKELFNYAKLLYQSGKLARAAEIIKRTKYQYISNEVFRLSANIYAEAGKYSDAEKEYKTAVFMVPNRVGSRYDLLNFYLQRKDTARARYWASSIVRMQVKVSSKQTEEWKRKAFLINKFHN